MEKTSQHSSFTPGKPWQSIRSRLFIYNTLKLFITILAIILVMEIMGSSLIEEQVFTNLSAIAEARAEQVSGIIERNFEHAALVASRTQLRRSLVEYQSPENDTEQARNSMNSILKDAQSSVGAIRQIDIVAPDGIVAASTVSNRLDKNDANTQWFKEGLAGKHQGEIYDEDGRLNFIVALPLLDPDQVDPEVIGVVKLDIDLDVMMDILNNRNGLGETGEILLVEIENDQIKALNPLRYPDEVKYLEADTGKILKCLPGSDAMCVGFEYVIREEDYRGVESLKARSMLALDNKNLGLIVKIDAAEALAPIKTLRNYFVLTGFILFSLGSASLIINMKAALVPLKNLREGTTRFGRGDFEYRINITSHDEIGELAHSFNLMAEKLLSYRDELQSYAESHKRMAENLRAERDRAQMYLDKAAGMFVSVNRDETVQLINEKGCQMLGLEQEEIIGKNWFDHFIPAGSRSEMKEFFKRIMNCESESVEFYDNPVVTADGRELLFSWQNTILTDDSGMMTGVLSSGKDITEQRKVEEKIRYFSFHDQLTGLYNRRYLEEEMTRLNTSRQLPLSVIMADINGLKTLNDTCGHEAGDRLLKAAAEILQNSCRSEDIIARWGGDEFLILLPLTGSEKAEQICARITALSAETVVEGLPVSIALGTASKQSMETNLDDLLKMAENLMYEDKRRSKND